MEFLKKVMRKYLLSVPVWEGAPFPSLISERWVDISLTAGVTDLLALRSDELLSLFALLILLSTVAIQIKAYAPLGSQGGGQPRRCTVALISVCVHVSVWLKRYWEKNCMRALVRLFLMCAVISLFK